MYIEDYRINNLILQARRYREMAHYHLDWYEHAIAEEQRQEEITLYHANIKKFYAIKKSLRILGLEELVDSI